MPFNKGPSELETGFQKEFRNLRDNMKDQNGLDLGHVLASMDVARSADILLNDAYASWAGDLGSAVLETFNEGTPLDIGNEETYAGMADLLADIDRGHLEVSSYNSLQILMHLNTLARHMQKGHELDALVAYYKNNGRYSGGAVAENRFESFANDLDLLDGDQNLCADAADRLNGPTMSFILQANFIENIKHNGDLFYGVLAGKAQDIYSTDIPALSRDACRQFADILRQGLQAEH